VILEPDDILGRDLRGIVMAQEDNKGRDGVAVALIGARLSTRSFRFAPPRFNEVGEGCLAVD
jgi:hypothetical protein